MEQREYMPLPDQRQTIHDMTLRKRASGLSPPEEEILLEQEAHELNQPEQSDDCPGYFVIKEIKS